MSQSETTPKMVWGQELKNRPYDKHSLCCYGTLAQNYIQLEEEKGLVMYFYLIKLFFVYHWFYGTQTVTNFIYGLIQKWFDILYQFYVEIKWGLSYVFLNDTSNNFSVYHNDSTYSTLFSVSSNLLVMMITLYVFIEFLLYLCFGKSYLRMN